MKLLFCIETQAARLTEAGVSFGHGTTQAFDEAAWLALWRLGLPLDALDALDEHAQQDLTPAQATQIAALVDQRIATRKPAAYLTREAWLQGVPFYVDERAIVPRSFIAELIADASIDAWLSEQTSRVLDLCTGNGSLAVLAAMAWPEVSVDAIDLSPEALEVARINVDKHGLGERIRLMQGDGLAPAAGQRYDLILCNPPYVNSGAMATLPAEYLAEPQLALAGGADGMDFVRRLLAEAPGCLSEPGVLVLEIGNERAFFEAAFPQLEVAWMETSAGEDQVLLLTREALLPPMITLRNITLRRGTKIVLDDASVTLQPGEKIGLVGRNGAGKSSLFSLLTDRLQSDKGDVEIPRQWAVGEVAQNMPETEMPATDFVLEGDTRLMAARRALEAAEAAEDGHAMADAHGLLMDAGAFDAKPRAQALLMGLGFKGDQVDAPVNSFSGGWRMRLQLARALMCPADLMLLDEPTNHLDLDALVWLEAWLQRYDGTLIVISHDREFLDAITKVTLHLDEAKLMRYGGNYTAFEAMRAERMVLQQAAFGKQQDRIAHLQKFIDRFKAKASKAKQAQSRVKALERMEKLAPVLASADFSFEFREPVNLPNPMLMFDQVACGYGEDNIIVRGIDRSVLAGQRIGILGANGQGKSTVVKTVARMQRAMAGKITEGKGLSIGYFAQQEMDVLRPDEGPLMHMVRLAKEVSPGAREQELRDFLGQFRFVGDMVNQAVGSLSGGEKARLVLAMLVWQRPNLLLLDEPTNHLDLQTREALSMALNEFEGTVMLVSHDRALLREVCDEFWLVTKGAVGPFDGDLDDYQKWLLEQSKEAARLAKEAAKEAAKKGATPATVAIAAPTPVAAPPALVPREDRKASGQARQRLAEQTKPLRKQMDAIDTGLKALADERQAIEAQLAAGSATPAQIAEAGKRLKAIHDELEAAELRWLELSAEVDAIQASAV